MTTREAEIERYVACYKVPEYRMGRRRLDDAHAVLSKLPSWISVLDVGAGRGELGRIADVFGMAYQGVEPVPYLATDRIQTGVATDLPFADKSFDLVACLDVLEHLIEADIEPALQEFKRVARQIIFLTASERSSMCSADKQDLHISKRPIADWHRMFVRNFPGARIKQLGMIGVSPGWLITLNKDPS